jgi:hypothetical protein
MTQSKPVTDPLISASLAEQFYVPLPSSSNLPVVKSSSALTPLVCDERAISRLLATLMTRGGLSVSEMARRLGVGTNGVRQYLYGRRTRPSLIWFIKFAELAGARVYIEFPDKSGRAAHD